MTSANLSPETLTFATLGLSPAIVKALPSGLNMPTRVQQLAIPAMLAGKDVLALAQTGSGKTLAFGLPLLQAIAAKMAASVDVQTSDAQTSVHALIIVPTRELAVQVSDALQPLAMPLMMQVQMLCGGVDKALQLQKLQQKPQLIVATPGRLLDILQNDEPESDGLALNQLTHLVLDEADRLLEMGFWPDIQKLLEFIPSERQTALFSATLPSALNALTTQLLKPSAQRIEAHTLNSVVDEIDEHLYLVNKGSKAQALISLLKQEQWPQVLVFISARDDADALAKKLRKAGVNAAALHGDKDQSVRSQTLADFKAQTITVLVATDLLARGIHVDALPVVINLDLPMSAPVYVHRIGRTARAGASGLAISLVCHGEMASLEAIRSLTQRALPLLALDGFAVTDKPADPTASAASDRKRPPRDKQANRRSLTKKSIKDFQGKR